jgi:hypothetical protein
MLQPENKHLLGLLVKVYNGSITDYYYFPEVIFAGTQKIERADFEMLLAEKLLTLCKYDSFGRYYVLSKKGETVLHQQLAVKHHRKKTAVPINQGCLYFTRFKNPHASGARCLLFL